MFPRPDSSMEDKSLEDFCARLRANGETVAIVLGGSAATGMNPSSDIDVAVVVDTHPCPARTGTTWVEGRLADLGFSSKTEVLASLAGTPSDRPDDWLSIIRAGRVVYDRDGIFSGLVTEQGKFETPSAVLFHRWDHTSYNLAQSRRYAQANDSLYHEALRLRMTYQLADVMLDYFKLRHLPWRGEKSAIRYWDTNDPEFKQEFLHCLEETELSRKFAAYERLVRLALAPIGEPWSRPAISMTPAQGFEETEALQFWLSLSGE